MTDRELLELAAKAAGYETIEYNDLRGSMLDIRYGRDEAIWNGEDYWNPLVDDCEALRLAVDLKLSLYINLAVRVDYRIPSEMPSVPLYEPLEPDVYAATRRAIVRAAAEIGKSMEVTK